MFDSVVGLGIPRRRFLAYGSACVASVFRPNAATNRSVATAVDREDVVPRLSVGYWPWAPLRIPRVIDARAVFEGDPEFVRRGARINITGLVPAGTALKSLSIDVAYHVSGHDSPVTFLAWHFNDGPIPHVSPGNSFSVPVSQETGLALHVGFDDDSGRKQVTSTFTVGGDLEQPKLLRGTYFLAPAPDLLWYAMDWRSVKEGPRRLVRRRALDNDSALADFPYVVMTIDYNRRVKEERA